MAASIILAKKNLEKNFKNLSLQASKDEPFSSTDRFLLVSDLHAQAGTLTSLFVPEGRSDITSSLSVFYALSRFLPLFSPAALSLFSSLFLSQDSTTPSQTHRRII